MALGPPGKERTAHGPEPAEEPRHGPYGPHQGLSVTGKRWTPNAEEKDSQPVSTQGLPAPPTPHPTPTIPPYPHPRHSPCWFWDIPHSKSAGVHLGGAQEDLEDGPTL